MTDQLHAKIAPFAVHGGRIDLARALFGSADWLDLSTGISPWAYPIDLPREALTRLPSPDDVALLFGMSLVQRGVLAIGMDNSFVLVVWRFQGPPN